MKHNRMQCKDIPDDVVIQAILNTPTVSRSSSWRMWREVHAQFEALMPDVPVPLFLAKVDKMRAVHACIHRPYTKAQCRGDVHLSAECGPGRC